MPPRASATSGIEDGRVNSTLNGGVPALNRLRAVLLGTPRRQTRPA